MPYCEINTNVEIPETDATKLIADLSVRVAAMLGKPESYVMVRVESGRTMRFGGSDDPLCLIRLASLGLPEERTGEFSAELSTFCTDRFGVAPDRCYIEFSSPPRHMWGYNGGTFG